MIDVWPGWLEQAVTVAMLAEGCEYEVASSRTLGCRLPLKLPVNKRVRPVDQDVPGFWPAAPSLYSCRLALGTQSTGPVPCTTLCTTAKLTDQILLTAADPTILIQGSHGRRATTGEEQNAKASLSVS
ncbi:hypothetical protein J1614_011763 [Plenodomus biglobosus]|nr:hypothetical protein J1614_011763 [Plenodomus biglobosus]